MILQVVDGGRLERIAIRGVPSREIEGREYIGGYRLDGALDEIWFDGLLIGSMALSAPFVYIQTERV